MAAGLFTRSIQTSDIREITFLDPEVDESSLAPQTPEPAPRGSHRSAEAVSSEAVQRLTHEAQADLDLLSHPSRTWTSDRPGPDGQPLIDVFIVGGGQSGIITAAALKREGLDRIVVVDQAARGSEGPWTTFARMPELRTPKSLVGSELGIPSLSVRRWFEATHGPESWASIDRIPTTDWSAYLGWYRTTTGVEVENEVHVSDIREGADGVVRIDTERAGRVTSHYARTVVLTTGFDASGGWQVPSFVSERLDASLYDHSNTVIDFRGLQGMRIGILGHGAAAFDNATAAVRAGAASVDICFRRDKLPRTNPHRHIETAGLMTHYPDLSDETRWSIAQYFRSNDQPPPEPSFRRAVALSGVTLRPSTPWLEVKESDGAIQVTTPNGPLTFDHLILATGAVIDLGSRRELAHIAPAIQTWRDAIHVSRDDYDPTLAALPYLNAGYGFEPLDDEIDWVRRVFAFNALSYVSQGPHSTSISGHRHALPRLVRGVTRQLFSDESSAVLTNLSQFESDDLSIPDDFEEQCRELNKAEPAAPRQESLAT